MKKQIRKTVVLSAAVCSSVFLLAACEPTSSSQSTEGTNQDSPTYGEQPERELDVPATEDETSTQGTQQQEPSTSPGMDGTQQQGSGSQWEENPSQAPAQQ